VTIVGIISLTVGILITVEKTLKSIFAALKLKERNFRKIGNGYMLFGKFNIACPLWESFFVF